MRSLACLLVLLLAGCLLPAEPAPASTTNTHTEGRPTATPACPGHWHVTLALIIPAANGTPERVDFASPRAPSGRPYYDLAAGPGGDNRMGLAVHMHQVGAETGDPRWAATQVHMEQDGTCTGTQEVLHVLEADVTATSLALTGGHAQAHQAGTWTAGDGRTMRFWVQENLTGTWTWHEVPFTTVAPRQLRDGESLLVAFGAYTDAQVTRMQQQVPAPMSR